MDRSALMVMLVGTLAASSATGCAESDGPIFILHNKVPGEGCTIPSALEDPYLPRGRIDASSLSGYIFNPLAQNNADIVEGANRIALVEGAYVNLTAEGATLPADDQSFTARFSGSIQPGGGLTSFSFILIPKSSLDAIAPVAGAGTIPLIADVQMFGELGGGYVESNVFTYVVDVCVECTTVNVGSCTNLSDSFVATTGGECNVAQDVPVQCCTSSTGTEVCPAVKEGA